MPLSLINKRIIISGGASGIGWSTAKICLSRGAIVYICDIDSKSLKKAQKHPLNKKKLFTYECDASDEYEVSNFFIKIKKKRNRGSQRGMTIVIRRPPAAGRSARTWPPCQMTAFLTIASPSPVPPQRLERPLSTR